MTKAETRAPLVISLVLAGMVGEALAHYKRAVENPAGLPRRTSSAHASGARREVIPSGMTGRGNFHPAYFSSQRITVEMRGTPFSW